MKKMTSCLLAGFALACAATTSLHAAFIVDPISATDNGHYSPSPGASATMTINGSILSNPSLVANGAPIPVSYPTTTAGPTAPSFFSNYAILTLTDDPGGPAVPTIIYTLDQAYTLSGGHFWQYSGDREPTGERSLTSADILVSSDNITYTPAGALVPGYVEGAYGSTDAGVDFSLLGSFSNVKYVELTNLVAPGDHDIRVAFNEIRFFANAVPEPGTLTLAGLGLLGLGWMGYKRRQRSA